MGVTQHTVMVSTRGRGTTDVTEQIAELVCAQGEGPGLCHVFVQHTSASLMVCENADPQVRRDLEAFMQRLTPDGDPLYLHTEEGPDDMPAHVRSVLTHTELTIPLDLQGRLVLGTWQGLYLWEHRTSAHERRLTVTIYR
ncbi:MAG: secondary thiamine-phosphate synthase enzyme YjbQ [Pseudomonadota bacterium]